MVKLTDEEIENIYELIVTNYEKHLKQHGVKLPRFKHKNGKYCKNILVLVKLAENYPDTNAISKKDLTSFMRLYYPDIPDVQQAKHLSEQHGWNISSGTRGNADTNKSEYKLISLEIPYSDFNPDRRKGFGGDFEEIKKQYNYRCATCGSREGEFHLFRTSVKVQLQMGHMNPTLPLKEGNIIPQCHICNRPARNKWIYDKKGRVIEVAPTNDGLRIVKKFVKRYSKIQKANDKKIKKIMKSIKK